MIFSKIQFTPRLLLTGLLTIYFTLAILYSVATPIFEAPDENYHFAVIQHIARTGWLPVQDPSVKTPYFQEGSQPPLYYLLTAPILAFVPGAAQELYPLEKNPHAQIGIGLARINRNFFLHSPAESFPWRGVPLAVHLIRLISVALGAWTVFCTYRIARCVLPDLPIIPLAAALFVAFNPMFLFIRGSINNDTLVTVLSASALWLLVMGLTSPSGPLSVNGEGFRVRSTWTILSLVLALAAITKLSGLTLYALAGGVLMILLLKRLITFRQLLIRVGVLAIGFILIAAWWYARNLQLYGDLTGLSVMIRIIEPRTTPYTFLTMLDEMQGLRISSWGLFGWLNLIGPGWLFDVMDALTWLALIGGVVWIGQQIRTRRWDRVIIFGVFGAQVLIIGISLINWTRLTPGTQGRLLFPALPAFAMLTVTGWYAIARLIRPALVLLPILPMALVAAAAPLFIIAPAYATPSTVQAIPADVIPASARFDQVEIVGHSVTDQAIAPGGVVPVTIYYRGQPDPRNLSLFLTVYDCKQQVIGKIDSYPGGGNLQTALWQPDKIYADHYDVQISDQLETPCQPTIELGWWDYATRTYIPRSDSTTGNQNRLIWRSGVVVDRTLPPPVPRVAQSGLFSGALWLKGYTLDSDAALPGGTLHVTLVWSGTTRIHEDFTVFVHLESGDGKLITDSDSPPRSNNYPTSVWQPGIVFEDTHTLKIPSTTPPGSYRIVIGLYRPRDLSRLPVDTGGDSAILNTPIEVK